MKRLMSMLLILLILSSCESDKLVQVPIAPEQVSLHFIALPDTVRREVNQSLDLDVLVMVRDSNGAPVSGVEVTFSVLSGICSFSDSTSVSAVTGIVTGRLHFAPNLYGRCTLRAAALSDTVVTDFLLIPVSTPFKIEITGIPNIIRTRPNQNLGVPFSAMVIDTSRSAIPGIKFTYRLSHPTGNRFGYIVDTTFYTSSGYGEEWLVATTDEEWLERQVSDSVKIQVDTFISLASIIIDGIPNWIYSRPGENVHVGFQVLVMDSNRVGVPGTRFSFELSNHDGRTFGYLENFTFNTAGSYGHEWLVVTADAGSIETQLCDSVEINVVPDEIGPNSLRIYSPRLPIRTLPGESVEVEFLAIVTDVAQNRVPGFPLEVRLLPISEGASPVGRITVPPRTNDSGELHILYNTSGQFGRIRLRITIGLPGGHEFTYQEITISVLPLLSANARFTSSVFPTFIEWPWPDSQATAIITAQLVDSSGIGIEGIPIDLSCDTGSITGSFVTDSTGAARAVWRNNYEFGIAVISIVDPISGYVATHTIVITNTGSRYRLDITTDHARMLHGLRVDEDPIRFRAIVTDRRSGVLVQGIPIHFVCDSGLFTQQEVNSSQFGIAESFYTPGQRPGLEYIRIYIQDDDMWEDTFPLLPGYPARARVTISPEAIYFDDIAEVRVAVMDTFFNPVGSGTLVRFASTLGEITSSAATNDSGVAVAYLTAGVTAGMAEVSISITRPDGRTILTTFPITFRVGVPNTIELTAEPQEILCSGVAGSGGATIRAVVRDYNGNLVTSANKVIFSLINHAAPPDGCSFRNGTRIDSAMTANGVAVMELMPGTRTGGVLIRAETWRDSARTNVVSQVLSTLAVISGPIAQFDIDVNEDAEDIGDGFWKLPITLRLWDLHRNPVSHAERYRISGSVEPPIAQLDIDGVEVGLVYHSRQSMRSVVVTVHIESEIEGSITGDRRVTLPLQHGNLLLRTAPQSWELDRDNPDDSCLVWVGARLIDGHGIDIDNALVQFRCSAGRFYRHNLLNDAWTQYNWNEEVALMTGQSGENDGEAVLYFVLKSREWQWGEENNGIVRFDAHVAGHLGISNQAELRLTRP